MNARMLFAVALLTASAGCGSSSSSPTAPVAPSPASSATGVSIVSGASTRTTDAFAPATVSVAAGGTVAWTNNDNTTHTSTGNNGAWNSGAIAPGARFITTFPTAGSFPYRCTIHPGMVGTVNVQ
jgi:plastocyanin